MRVKHIKDVALGADEQAVCDSREKLGGTRAGERGCNMAGEVRTEEGQRKRL